MNFTDFTDDLADEFGLTKRDARKIITFLAKKLKKRLSFGEQVSIRNLGTFILRIRQPKKFLHLKTGKLEMSKKCYYLSFKVTDKMANELKAKTVY